MAQKTQRQFFFQKVHDQALYLNQHFLSSFIFIIIVGIIAPSEQMFFVCKPTLNKTSYILSCLYLIYHFGRHSFKKFYLSNIQAQTVHHPDMVIY